MWSRNHKWLAYGTFIKEKASLIIIEQISFSVVNVSPDLKSSMRSSVRNQSSFGQQNNKSQNITIEEPYCESKTFNITCYCRRLATAGYPSRSFYVIVNV